MNTFVLAGMGISAFSLGYFLYSRFIAGKIYALDPEFRTPVHEMEDGIDFVSTNP